MGAQIRGIARDEQGVTVRFREERPAMRFDEVVFATHGDQVLPLLEDATEKEKQVLGAFQTSRNDVVLHTDESLLPKRKAARASWNYLLHMDERNGHSPVTMTYHMNRLQSLPVKENYCVTLNANAQIRPERVVRKFIYNHPLYTLEAIAAQKRWSEISGSEPYALLRSILELRLSRRRSQFGVEGSSYAGDSGLTACNRHFISAN